MKYEDSLMELEGLGNPRIIIALKQMMFSLSPNILFLNETEKCK